MTGLDFTLFDLIALETLVGLTTLLEEALTALVFEDGVFFTEDFLTEGFFAEGFFAGDDVELATERAKGDLKGVRLSCDGRGLSGKWKRAIGETFHQMLPMLGIHFLAGVYQLKPHSTYDPFFHKAAKDQKLWFS